MEYTLAGEDGLEWDDEYCDPDLNYSSEDEDWELEDYMDEEESSEVTSDMGLQFQLDTSDLDSFKDKWMNN
jgi:lipid II:glycine glycyltransferase (peptidoglycan interpeptide bridge formation enzyme)